MGEFQTERYIVPTWGLTDSLPQCKDNAAKLGIDPSLIITCGSSAGGGMAAALTIMARDNNEGGIVGQVLNGPVLCHPKFFPKDKYEYTSWEQNKDASILTARHMLLCWDAYCPDIKPDDVYANPLLVKSTAGLPPTREKLQKSTKVGPCSKN